MPQHLPRAGGLRCAALFASLLTLCALASPVARAQDDETLRRLSEGLGVQPAEEPVEPDPFSSGPLLWILSPCGCFGVLLIAGAAGWFMRNGASGLFGIAEPEAPVAPRPASTLPIGAQVLSRTRSTQVLSSVLTGPQKVGTKWDVSPIQMAGKNDPHFSVQGLMDFLLVLHRRATEDSLQGVDLAMLFPYSTPPVRDALVTARRGVTAIELLLVDTIECEQVDVQAHWTHFRVKLETLRHLAHGTDREAVAVEERWDFRRAALAKTRADPEAMLELGCPSCGARVGYDSQGECQACKVAVNWGQMHWQASDVHIYPPVPISAPVHEKEPLPVDPPQIRDGGEPMRDFQQRRPDLELEPFYDWFREVYLKVREAWAKGDWEIVRPHVTDHALNRILFRSEKHSAFGWWEHTSDIEIQDLTAARYEADGPYDVITLYVSGKRLHWVTSRAGELIRGDNGNPKPFGEHWSLRRRSDAPQAPLHAYRCPSCNRALDAVDNDGMCKHCGQWITTGRFGWVICGFWLERIVD